jgi:hypothetical protein
MVPATLQAKLMSSIILANIVEAGVRENHSGGLVPCFIYDSGIIGSVELRTGHKRGAQWHNLVQTESAQPPGSRLDEQLGDNQLAFAGIT